MVWLIILLVLFVMAMFLWVFELLGAASRREWLAWIVALILGIVVFLVGSGTLVWVRS